MHTPHPPIGYGTADLTGDAAELVKSAIRAGYRFVDTAQAYGTEAAVGKAVRELVVSEEIQRSELYIQSKISDTHGYQETLNTVNGALHAMGIDYFDSYLIHWPVLRYCENCWRDKNNETWRAMEDLHYEGKIRYLGVSNFAERHLLNILWHCRIKPTWNQLEIHPDFQQRGLTESCKTLGIGVQAWSPLGRDLLHNTQIIETAAKYQKTAAQLLISYCLQKGFYPVSRSSTPDHIKGNLQTFAINNDDMQILDNMNTADSHLDVFSYKRRDMY